MAIRTQEWKFIRFPDGRRELYDLGNDPGERQDLARSKPGSLEVFEALSSMALAEREGARAASVPLDEETIRKLRSLGYIE